MCGLCVEIGYYTIATHFFSIIISYREEEEDVMCIPHGVMSTKNNGFIKESRPKKHIKKPSKNMLEKGDPDFVDERISANEQKKEESFFDKLFKD